MNWKEQLNVEIANMVAYRSTGTPVVFPKIIKDFISTQIIEKLIDELPKDPFHCSDCVSGLKSQLRNKWL